MYHYVNDVRTVAILANVPTAADLTIHTLYAVLVGESGDITTHAASVVGVGGYHDFESEVMPEGRAARYITASLSDAIIFRLWTASFMANFGKGEIVVEYTTLSEDDGSQRLSVCKYGVLQVISEMVDLTTGRYACRPSELPTTRKAAAQAIADKAEGECGVRVHLTRKAFRAAREEARRARLEETAAAFLSEHKLTRVDSAEFVRAARKAVRRLSGERREFFGGEQRMERHGAHAASGAGEAFWENEDHASGEFDREADRLQDVLTYVRQRFPLFWAGYQEARRANKARKAEK